MTEQILTEAEIADLRCLAGMIIPPSAKYGVPGADDDTIFADIVNSIGRDADHLRAALARLLTLAGGPALRWMPCAAVRWRRSCAPTVALRSACSPGSCCSAITAMTG